MKIGDRVIDDSGWIGIVEEISNDPYYRVVDVRWLTPNNKLSIASSTMSINDITVVPDNVVMMPKPKEWNNRAKEFHDLIVKTIDEEFSES